MYIPELTNNKEIKKCIKFLCSKRGENKNFMRIKKFEIIKVFPDTSNHELIVSTYNEFYVYDDGSRDEWTQFQILHKLKDWLIDGVEVKLKSNDTLHFTYNRSIEHTPLQESKWWKKEPYYLDSPLIDWNKFANCLKLWVIENL